ncbi:hypothetical protein [Streptomyces sp. NPDC019208]|uniref:hypothetical protein n=1 Tax=Streptomyces sp. NPDC019208 TaxID=3154683 RepID=UPI0033C8D8B2
MAERLQFILDGRDRLSNVLNSAGDSAIRLHRRLGDTEARVSESLEKMRKSLMSLAPAAIPAAAALAPVGAAAGAAAVGVGAYMAALGPQVKAIGEATEAEKAYQDALDEHGATSQEAVAAQAEYARAMGKLPPATQKAAASMSVLKDVYKEWSDSLAQDTMAPFTKGLQLTTAALPKLTPLVKGTSRELDRMVTLLAGGMQSPGFDALVEKFAGFSQGSLAKVNEGIVKLVRNLDSGKVSGGVSEFMAYARANGPVVADTLKNVGDTLLNLLVAGADVGVGLLQVVNALSKLAATVPTELLTTLLQVVVAMKLIKLGSAAFTAMGTAAAGAAGNLATFTRAARFGGVSAAVQGLTQRFSALQKAGAALAVLGIAAMAVDELARKARGAPPDVDKLRTSLMQLAESGRFGGELAKTFGSLDGMAVKFQRLRTESAGLAAAKPWLALAPMGGLAEALAPKLDDLTRGAKSFGATKEDFKGVDQVLADMVSSGYADQAADDFATFSAMMKAGGATTAEVADTFSQYRNSVAAAEVEQDIAARGMGLFGEQAIAAKGKLDAQKASADGLRLSIHALAEAQLMARGGVRAMEAAIDAANQAAKENGRTLDENTAKGRANNQAVDDLVSTTLRAAAASRENGASWQAVNAITEQGRAELVKVLIQMGKNEGQARSLANTLLGVPMTRTALLKGNLEDLKAKLRDAQARLRTAPLDKQGKIRGEISDLKNKIAEAERRMSRIDGRIATTYITTVMRTRDERMSKPLWQAQGGPVRRAQGGIIGFPGGGMVRGPGTSTSDSIPAFLSDGEFVIRASSAKRIGLETLHALNRGSLLPARQTLPAARTTTRTAPAAAPVDIPALVQSVAATVAASFHGQQLRLVVDGREFSAYVDARADAQATIRVREGNTELVQVLNAGGGR